MKMPSSVTVGPYVIAIKELVGTDMERDYGHFDSVKMEIRLQKEFATPQQAADTLLHEVLHAVWHIAGLNHKDGEERLVASLSTQICAVVRQNPDIVRWLQKALK